MFVAQRWRMTNGVMLALNVTGVSPCSQCLGAARRAPARSVLDVGDHFLKQPVNPVKPRVHPLPNSVKLVDAGIHAFHALV
jgi:hypothetical protein